MNGIWLTRIALGMLTFMAHSLHAEPSAQQQLYLDARQAQIQGDTAQYQQLRQRLGQYPLTLYLNYHEQIDTLHNLSTEQFKAWVNQFEGSPLYAGARHRFLDLNGKQQDWQSFLAISPSRPRSTELQCYYYRAKLAQGDKLDAYQGAQSLWLHGYSQPKACDPLFSAWKKAGKLTEALIWQRMMLAFDARQTGLLNHLARSMGAHKAQAQLLIKIYRDPRQLRNNKQFSHNNPMSGDIVATGLRKLARNDLNKAFDLFETYQASGLLSERQTQQVAHYLSRRVLIHQQAAHLGRVDDSLAAIGSDDLIEMRLRWAIRDNDKPAIAKFLPLLSSTSRQKSRWLYWQARTNSDSQLWQQLSQQRNFYGFFAAQQLHQDYQLTHQALPELSKEQVANLTSAPAWLRIIELKALDKTSDARSEWLSLLNHSQDKMAYGQLALQTGWDDYAVQASISGKYWDHLDLRFPLAHQSSMEPAAKRHQVDLFEIMAIARRESALYPRARSGVGALGLMQVMPATAKQTAKRYNMPFRHSQQLYDPDYNANIGSGYYKYLLDKYQGNRVLAIAAYNAGPSRINAWLKRADGQLDTMAFIESIPFKETREYVQAVVSYRIIYQALHGNDALTPLFNPQELEFNY
ncbi:transglycosylase SLT domain-containing protein [Shewanella sp. NIFS-20-20]|uniref:transglycosylase SLT domain-containing protein n=1 Tax=Shewanella sp. NIFS-20-20 TaxID=2853806 RepID=UPI001C467E6C|nr:transglycosylase SLT domain-containing protein [Shewanella sp. NIFS-20-20]MBV7315074.1 transglycosylase SLT domain-containing protein [Shewanella sp. NIFS-20-20]